MIQLDENFDAKNIIINRLGKSYFLNMLLKDQTPAQGVLTVYDRLESGTHVCQMKMNRNVQYGPTQEEVITLNLIDTPGLFDTHDNPNVQYHLNHNQISYISYILHLKNIQNTVINKHNINFVLKSIQQSYLSAQFRLEI